VVSGSEIAADEATADGNSWVEWDECSQEFLVHLREET
jgi:hypothetical protein